MYKRDLAAAKAAAAAKVAAKVGGAGAGAGGGGGVGGVGELGVDESLRYTKQLGGEAQLRLVLSKVWLAPPCLFVCLFVLSFYLPLVRLCIFHSQSIYSSLSGSHYLTPFTHTYSLSLSLSPSLPLVSFKAVLSILRRERSFGGLKRSFGEENGTFIRRRGFR